MAVDNKASNKLPAAAWHPAEEVSHPLPVGIIVKPPRPSSAGAAVLVDVKTPPPPASPAAVLPAADDHNKNKKDRILLMTVCLWALFHAFTFAFQDISILTNTKWAWMGPPYVALADAAAAEASALLHGQLWCIAAAALAAPAPLYMLLTARTTTTGCWAAFAVDALAWVALAATAGIHGTQVASDRIYLAADPGKTSYFFLDVVLTSSCLTLDAVLAGFLLFLLCRRRLARCLGLGEHQGEDDGSPAGRPWRLACTSQDRGGNIMEAKLL